MSWLISCLIFYENQERYNICHSQLTVAGSDESSVDAEVLRSDDNDVSPVRTAPSSVSSCNTDLQSSVI